MAAEQYEAAERSEATDTESAVRDFAYAVCYTARDHKEH